MTQMVEVIRVRVPEDKADAFVSGRPAVDAEVGQLDGCLGSELVHVTGDEWLLLVYWRDRAAVEAAQKITADMKIISDWLAPTQFISFNTSEIRHSSR